MVLGCWLNSEGEIVEKETVVSRLNINLWRVCKFDSYQKHKFISFNDGKNHL